MTTLIDLLLLALLSLILYCIIDISFGEQVVRWLADNLHQLAHLFH